MVSTGRLLRGSRDAQGVRHGAEVAKVLGELGDMGTTVAVELRRGTRKRVELNGMGLPRASDLLGRLPSVSFSATDLVIVTGEPGDRRQFLDWELAQLFPSYLKHLSVYKRALEQRNALLRQAQEGPVPEDVFVSWEEQLAASGSGLRIARADWVKELSVDAAAAHGALGEGEELGLAYEARDDGSDRESLAELLASGRGADIARGSTGTGPHRDELVVTVGGQEARHYGSQGQQRTAVIAMKLAVLACAERQFTSPPVLLLDDVFSDLDQSRRNRLMELTLGRGGQVFLTCTEAEQAGADLIERAKVFVVESGQVRES